MSKCLDRNLPMNQAFAAIPRLPIRGTIVDGRATYLHHRKLARTIGRNVAFMVAKGSYKPELDVWHPRIKGSDLYAFYSPISEGQTHRQIAETIRNDPGNTHPHDVARRIKVMAMTKHSTAGLVWRVRQHITTNKGGPTDVTRAWEKRVLEQGRNAVRAVADACVRYPRLLDRLP